MRAARFAGSGGWRFTTSRARAGLGQVLLRCAQPGLWHRFALVSGRMGTQSGSPRATSGALVEQLGPDATGPEPGQPVCLEPLCVAVRAPRAWPRLQPVRAFTLIGGP